MGEESHMSVITPLVPRNFAEKYGQFAYLEDIRRSFAETPDILLTTELRVASANNSTLDAYFRDEEERVPDLDYKVCDLAGRP